MSWSQRSALPRQKAYPHNGLNPDLSIGFGEVPASSNSLERDDDSRECEMQSFSLHSFLFCIEMVIEET